MACRNICDRDRVEQPGHKATRYARGLGYCRRCEAWFDTGKPAGVVVRCPCCRQYLRRTPTRPHARAA